MPSDANGVYSLPAGYLAVTGQTIQPSQHNPPLEDIASALTARLSANGTNPMSGALRLVDGLVGAPGLTFNTAQTTGLYKTAGGNIGVAISGTETVEFGPNGIHKGGKLVGELFDWTGATAPALCVLPFGQTLLRASYPDLWAFAQIQIAAGSTFYNNGNGTTTFGIGDCRGRVRAGKDDMGGSAVNRLTSGFFGADAKIIGSTGGAESHTLTLAQLPTGITAAGTATGIGKAGNVIPTVTAGTQFDFNFSSAGAGTHVPATGGGWTFDNNTLSGSASVTSNNTSGNAHHNVQPTIVVNCALFAGA